MNLHLLLSNIHPLIAPNTPYPPAANAPIINAESKIPGINNPISVSNSFKCIVESFQKSLREQLEIDMTQIENFLAQF
jgi:hypothetical protein